MGEFEQKLFQIKTVLIIYILIFNHKRWYRNLSTIILLSQYRVFPFVNVIRYGIQTMTALIKKPFGFYLTKAFMSS